MDLLNAGEHLLGRHNDRLDREAPAAHVEQVFERGAEQVDDKNVVQTFIAEVVDLRNASCKAEEKRVTMPKSATASW